MTVKSEVEATSIDVIAPLEKFVEAHKNGEVSRQHHPDYPYSIFKYSQATTFSKNWNDITLASRGLVVNNETGEILARPFGKFFNYSEGATPAELMVGPMVVSEKLDGSLAISYQTPDGLQITTAGGFQSEQAAHATALYREKYEGNWSPREGVTYMWEIIYPSNRIVVDYGDKDDLVLLGAVNIRSGKSIPLSDLKEWKGERATEFTDLADISAVVSAPERSNHEGYVIHFPQTDTRVKFKHAEYLQHHRYATGINSRRVWEMMQEKEDMGTWRMNAPEEFESYINDTEKKIQSKFDAENSRVQASYDSFAKAFPVGGDQKAFALAVQSQVPVSDRGLFFGLRTHGVDDRYNKTIWDRVKPDFEKSFWSAGSGSSESPKE